MKKKLSHFRTGLSISIFSLSLMGQTHTVSAAALNVPEGMVHVPSGFFVMGVDQKPGPDMESMSPIKQLKFKVSKEAFHDEGPAHVVMLDDYFIDQYEVSVKQYGEFMQATGHATPAYWDDHRFNKPTQPVTGVNWFDANAFCAWSNKRLPTEAEWEKAARGPEGLRYPWGDVFKTGHANFDRQEKVTSDVDSFPEGKSFYGVYNMAGNVFEWVSDWYDPNYYGKTKQALNPKGPEDGVVLGSTGTYVDRVSAGAKKVIRGGSWYTPAQSITSTHRFWNNPMNNSYGIGLGFRCARDVSTDKPMQARDHYMNALINMGAMKFKAATMAIDKAISIDPSNVEYQKLKTSITEMGN